MPPSPRDPLHWLDEELAKLEAATLRRRLRTLASAQGPRIDIDRRELINFGSNDYLSLAADERLSAAVCDAAGEFGWGSGASPLICGRHRLHAELEQRLAEFEGAEAALLFPSGFAANAGIIPALVGEQDIVITDQKNHASIIDGCRLARAEVSIYPHNDADTAAALLGQNAARRRKLIVTDGLFSMDGDLAPLPALVQLAEAHGAMLLVDEAHATGVFGERGRGAVEHYGIESPAVIRIGTLSKALGCAGGFVVGRQSLIDWLTNRARPYIFSTAPPAAHCAAAMAALEIVRAEPQRRQELLTKAEALRQELHQRGWPAGRSASQIIPVSVGDPQRTMRLSTLLQQAGYFVPGIRPPSVPAGESLLRISLNWGHDEAMIAGLLRALDAGREQLDGA